MINLGILEDDLEIKRHYLRYIEMVDHIECVIEAASVEEFEGKLVHVNKLDVVLSDIELPGKSGVQGIRIIKDQFPDVNILMFTVNTASDRVFNSLCAGATGYMLKSTRLPKVIKAIEQVHAGDAPMSPSIARKVIEYFAPKRQNENALTKREHEVVRGIVDGLSYKMIAAKLFISFETVKSHVKNIYSKLHVHSKAELIAMSYKGRI